MLPSWLPRLLRGLRPSGRRFSELRPVRKHLRQRSLLPRGVLRRRRDLLLRLPWRLCQSHERYRQLRRL
jgi:hypothetical protein